jgi:hypothetical protein
LVALAVALRVSPVTLLMPEVDSAGPKDRVEMTGTDPSGPPVLIPAQVVWEWLTAQRPIVRTELLLFWSRAWPKWCVNMPSGRFGRKTPMATIESYETADGKRYQVRYRTPQRTQTKKRGFKTKRDAQEFAATVEVKKMSGEYVAPAAGRVTVGERGLQWLGRQTHLKPSYSRTVEVAWRVHVEPRWGRCRLADVEHSGMQQWVSDMIQRGSGATTVIRAYGVLAAILDEAVKDRLLASNPARGVKLPRKKPKPRAYLTDSQVWQLAAEAGDKGVIVLLLAYTGLRGVSSPGCRSRMWTCCGAGSAFTETP